MTFDHMNVAELHDEFDVLRSLIDNTPDEDSNFEAYCSAFAAVSDEIQRRYWEAPPNDPAWDVVREIERVGDVPRMLTA